MQWKKRGFELGPLLNPKGVHISLTWNHSNKGDKIVEELKKSVKHINEYPDQYKGGSVGLYGTATSLPDSTPIRDFLKKLFFSLNEVNLEKLKE